MKNRILKIIGVFIFIIALVVNMQINHKQNESSLLIENLEAMALAYGEEGGCPGGTYYSCKYIRDLGVCAMYARCEPSCPTGC